METISIKDENGKEYEFEKPEFECELLKAVNGYIVAHIVFEYDNFAMLFYLDGSSVGSSIFNLSSVKPKWYEDEKNFPALFVDLEDNNMATVCERKVHYDNVYFTERYRLATKEELLSLYYQDKEK